MNTPPRRARFQIHLSTAIVLMFVAGGLMWANIRARTVASYGMAAMNSGEFTYLMTESEFLGKKIISVEWAGNRLAEHGWPFDAIRITTEVLIHYSGDIRKQRALPPECRGEFIIYNAVIALAILFAVWFVCEWLIRRRAARKGG